MATSNIGFQESNLNPLPVSAPQSQAQPQRSPEIEAEVEHIRKSDTYHPVKRDLDLHAWLEFQRKSRANGYIVSSCCADLRKSCQGYRMKYVRKRGNIHTIPMPVIYAEAQQNGSPSDLLRVILEELSNPFAGFGRMRELRSRAWATLKTYKVEILVVGSAQYLSYEAMNEMVQLTRNVKISVVVIGSLYLDEILKRQNRKYAHIFNTFLNWQDFPGFRKEETAEIVASWENQVLGSWSEQLHLASDADLLDLLYERTEGHAEALYEILREIAVLKLDNPKFQPDLASLKTLLGTRHRPIHKI